MTKKILVVKKMSALEFYYNGDHESEELKESHKQNGDSIDRIVEKLTEKGFSPRVVTRKQLTPSLVDEHDYVSSAGGDGTVIVTAAFNKSRPQLNLRTDIKSKGALCFHNIAKAIEAFAKGDYKIEEWTRQEIYLDDQFIGRVLNETCIGEQLKFQKMARYNIRIDNKSEYHENSGIIIATGTGSTGWPSAFEPHPKSSQIFKFRTILPTKGSKKGEGKIFEIQYKHHEGKFAIDTIEYDLPRDSILKINPSENPLKVICVNE